MKFQIVCDSSADLSSELAKENNISVVPFYVSLDGNTYLKEGVDISVTDFYKAMEGNPSCFPKTSMPSLQDYIDVFTPFARDNVPVLCICLTKAFSGSYQSALNAREAVLEDFPKADIYVMDSQSVTAVEGLLVMEAARLRDMGMTMEEAVPLVEDIRSSGQIFFTTKDLKYLEHGGRIGKAAGIAGSMLNLKPVLRYYDGELGPAEVAMGRKKSLEKVTERFFHYLSENNIDLKNYWFGTGIGLPVPEYEPFKKNLEKRFAEEGIRAHGWVKIQIGATIGVHTGPYPVGLGILKRCEV